MKYFASAALLLVVLAGCTSQPTSQPTTSTPPVAEPTITIDSATTSSGVVIKPEVTTIPSTDTTTGSAPITVAELGKHNTLADCWVAYKGSVYDITSFIPNHKGGAVIVPFCGTSTTFETAAIDKHGAEKIGNSLPVVGVLKGPLQ